MSLDPASLQILISRLGGIADEMGAVLRRAAYSPNIKERADCSAALFTAGGELLAQAEHIPVHLGSMPASVAAAIEAIGTAAAGGGARPGDEIVVNDPFAGGTHLNDITMVTPCFVEHELVGWVANRAHHADVGGIAPGSMPPDATEHRGRRSADLADPARRRARGAHRDVLAHPGRTARRPRCATRCEPTRRCAHGRRGRSARFGRATRRDRRLRGTPHARRVAIASRRSMARRRRARLRRATTPPAVADASHGHAHRRRRGRGLRLHRYRRAARRQRQRSGSGDDQRGRVRDPRRDGSDDARERRRDAAGACDHATGHGGRGDPARCGRRGQRRGEPARRRPVPRRARAGSARIGSARPARER